MTRAASPPSRADAAKISPRATNATLRPSGESARLLEAGGQRQVLGHRTDRRAAAADRHLGRAGPTATSSVQIAEVALEDDRAAVVRDVRPQHAAGPELRDLRAADPPSGLHPDVLGAAAIGHEEQAAAVGAPHRPVVLARRDRRPSRSPSSTSPRMIQISDSSRCEWPLRHHCPGPLPRALNAIALPVGRRRRGELVREPIGAHRHRHAAGARTR